MIDEVRSSIVAVGLLPPVRQRTKAIFRSVCMRRYGTERMSLLMLLPDYGSMMNSTCTRGRSGHLLTHSDGNWVQRLAFSSGIRPIVRGRCWRGYKTIDGSCRNGITLIMLHNYVLLISPSNCIAYSIKVARLCWSLVNRLSVSDISSMDCIQSTVNALSMMYNRSESGRA